MGATQLLSIAARGPWMQAGPSASPFVMCYETGAQVSGDPGRPAQFSASVLPQSE